MLLSVTFFGSLILVSSLEQVSSFRLGDVVPSVGATSCKEIHDEYRTTENKAYTLQFGGQNVSVYCSMDGTDLGDCGCGGWTLVMKIDGSKRTFHYDSSYWTDKKAYGIPEGETGLDQKETKLPTYWNTPFTRICLGMKTGDETRFILLGQKASSLYSLIQDGKYRPTSLGRDTWKNLIGPEASLQGNCNREGFNVKPDDSVHSKARVGYIANQENDCNSPDSRIGFGTGGKHDDSNTCGNEATYDPDNGVKHIKAMGYILVQ